MQRGVVQPVNGQRGMNARSGGFNVDLWSRRPGVKPCCTPPCRFATRETHRAERRAARREIREELDQMALDLIELLREMHYDWPDEDYGDQPAPPFRIYVI